MRRKQFLRAAGALTLRGLMLTVRVLPFPIALALGRRLGDLMRLLSKKRHRVALKNLRIAFGDSVSEAEQARIARESFRHFGMFAIEAMKFSYLAQSEVERRIVVDEEAYGQFLAHLNTQRKGCLYITAHIGNFELMARWGSARGHEVIGLVREARDLATTQMMTRLRESSGIQVLSIRQSLKPVVEGLRRNACVAIVCDQNAADVFVPFFGHPTGTVDGPAKIALRYGAPMYFVFCVRDKPGRYRVVSAGPYQAESTGDEKADIERVMTEVNCQIESVIRRYPEQWLWFHDRWKSSPAVRDGLDCRVPERLNA